jgi:uncharacterized Fe-S cluster protein YjdI
MGSGIVKRYSNGEITVIWQPDLCCHSTICYTELPSVFDPSSRPWIKPGNAKSEQIIKIVKACPTDALMFEVDKPKEEEEKAAEPKEKEKTVVHLIPNGPVKIKAASIVTDELGIDHTFESSVAICRCGKSENHPFCDGTHRNL